LYNVYPYSNEYADKTQIATLMGQQR
jgi:hypothetical protein